MNEPASFAGGYVRALVFACLTCSTKVVQYNEPGQPALTLPDADARLREKGWEKRKGAWHCGSCAEKIAVKRPKYNTKTHLTLVK